MVDRTVAELRERTQNLFRCVAVSRDGKTIIPKSATRFKTGDVVYLVSKKEGMEQALSLSGKSKVAIRNLMILGGGRIGEMVARSMEKQVDNIRLIELKPENASTSRRHSTGPSSSTATAAILTCCCRRAYGIWKRSSP